MTFTPEQRESAARDLRAQGITHDTAITFAIDLCCERDQARRERDLAREALRQIRQRINQCSGEMPDYIDYCAVIATDGLGER